MNQSSIERGATGHSGEASLEELLTFERLLADLSSRFANVAGDQVETEIGSALKQLLEFLDFDRSNFGEFNTDGWAIILCSVARGVVEEYTPGPAPAFLSWYNAQLRAEKILHVRSIDDLPPEAAGEREYYRRSGSEQRGNPTPRRWPRSRPYQFFGFPHDPEMARGAHRPAKNRRRGNGAGAGAKALRGCTAGGPIDTRAHDAATTMQAVAASIAMKSISRWPLS